jgi:hypothetical protein
MLISARAASNTPTPDGGATSVLTAPSTSESTRVPPSASPTSANAPTATPKPTPAGPTLTEQVQGKALNALLDQTAPARQLVITALSSIDNCTATSSTYADLNQAITVRNSVLTQLASLQLSELPNSGKLRDALQSAESASLLADQHYLAWSQNASYGCSGQAIHDSEYAAASLAGQDAVSAKANFVALWKPVALSLHLPTRTSLDL